MLTRRDLPGILLAVVLGSAALSVSRLWPSAWFSDVVAAIALGALVANTPLRRWLGFHASTHRDVDRFEPGLRFVGKWLLRAAIILMGLKFQVRVYQTSQLWTTVVVIAFTMPAAYFIAQLVAARLALRREMADLISIGTMVCGASAINALAPVVGARRTDQALSITSVFIFSVVALIVFHPLGLWLGLTASEAGLWSGLAVNDLAGTVAVGTQFTDDAAIVATAAKSVRIALLGPALLAFALLARRRGGSATKKTGWAEHLPKFILGYVALCVVRFVGDRVLGDAPAWGSLLAVNDVAVKMLVLTVGGGIGLAIEARVIIQLGWRALTASAAASATTACLSLAMIRTVGSVGFTAAIVLGAVALTTAAALWWLGERADPELQRLVRRFHQGAELSMREATDLFELHDDAGTLSAGQVERIMRQVHPAIGELQPLREAPVAVPYNYRRMTYWKSTRGPGELIALLWLPGTGTHIHSHDGTGIGKTVEGQVEVLEFLRAGSKLRLAKREVVQSDGLMTIPSPAYIHRVRNVVDRSSIDLHFYWGNPDAIAESFEPREPLDFSALTVGDAFEVTAVQDVHPAELFTEEARARLHRRTG